MANCANKNRLSHQGFTLIEMAIVLVIVGLLMGLGMSMVGPLMTATKLRETRDSLDANMQAVASWASANNRIPPLTPTLPDTAKFVQIAKNPNDSWLRPFVYLYDSNLAPTGATSPTKDTICGRRSTFLNISTHNPDAYIQNVAYAVASSGDKMSFASTLTGGSSGIIANTAVSGAATTIHGDRNANDILRWVTLDELRSKVGCQGAPLKIVNNELPFIPQTTAVSSTFATISADGGVPSYRWCVEFATRTGISMFDTSPVTGGIKATGTCWTSDEATWLAPNNTLALQKKAAMGNFSTGSYQVTIFVRDNAATTASTASCSSNPGDNCIQKPFVLTVNPQ
jgi:prepilin-type N-terminal cleavage/methylation domain-containing protein